MPEARYPRSRRIVAAVLSLALAMAGFIGVSAPAQAINNWGTPAPFYSGLTPTKPMSAVSADGKKVIAAWTLYVNPNTEIWYAVGTVNDDNTQTWGTPTMLSSPSGGAQRPQVKISADGSRVAIAFSDLSTGVPMWSASGTVTGNNVTWGALTNLGNSTANKVSLAMSDDGSRLFLAYRCGNDMCAVIGKAEGNVQTWGTVDVLTTPGNTGDNAFTNLSADGKTGTVFWTESVSAGIGGAVSRTFTSADGTNPNWGTRTEITPVGTAGLTASFTRGASSADGKSVVLVWVGRTQSGGPNQVLSASAVVNGNQQTWGTVNAIEDNGQNAWAGISADGTKATLTWVNTDNNEARSVSGLISNGVQDWGTPQDIGQTARSSDYDGRFLLSADGKIAVIVANVQVQDFKVWSNTAAVNGKTAVWQTPVHGFTDGGNSEPTLGISRSGLRATVVWSAGSSGLMSASGGTVDPAPTVTSVSPTSGPKAGGGRLVIKGSYLEFATSVKIGGTACTGVKYDRAKDELSCTIPSSTTAGAKDVVVTSPSGSGTKAGAYTYTGSTPPVKTKKPGKPGATKVSGSPTAKKIKVSWTTPPNKSGVRPTQYFRIKLNLVRCSTLIVNKKLSKKTHSYTFSRSFLLKHSKCVRDTRGETKGKIPFRVRIEAFNKAGGGPVSARAFTIKR